MADEREYFERLYRNARSDAERRAIEHNFRAYTHSIFKPYPAMPSFGGLDWSDAYSYAVASNFPALPMPKEKPVTVLPEEHMVQAIVGFRAWNVPLFVDELRSVAKSAKWKPYQRFEAECESSQCSGVSCACGIYAFKKIDNVQAEYKSTDRSKRYVWGECWLWGRILECAQGYRAQFGYPKAFVNSGAIAKRMSEVFGVSLLAE